MELVIQLFRHIIKDTDDNFTKYRKQLRQHEYDFCFQYNINNPLVRRIHVFIENTDDINYYIQLAGVSIYKVNFIHFGKQPHYKDFIYYVQKNISENTVVCIMNGDLIIDKKLPMALIDTHVNGNTMFGLTRHEFTDEEHPLCTIETCNLIHNYWGSADVFIMRTPIDERIPLQKIDFKQNLFGAENIFQKTLKETGYRILNPCHQIRTFHVHHHRQYFHSYETIGNHLDFNEPPSYL